MRRLLGLLLMLGLVLTACAETPEPTLPAAKATAALPTEKIRTPAAAPSRAPSVPPATIASASPTPRPEPMTAPSSDAPWPAYLRALDFGIAAGNSYGPRAMAVHPGMERLYARTRSQASGAPGQVTVIDCSSGEVLALVETGLDDYADGAVAVDTERNRVYAVDAGDASATVFDAETLELITTIEGVDLLAIDSDGGRLYVAGLAGLRTLDAEQYDVLGEVPVSYAPHFLEVTVDPAGSRVHLVYQEDSGYVLGQFDAETLQQLAITSLPGRPESLAADPNRNHVHIALNDGERSLLWVVDGNGRSLEERDLGEWTQNSYLALDPADDRLFVGREAHNNNGIWVVDLDSGQEIADIPLDLAPSALTWDAEADRLWVSHTYADKIRAVDIEAGETGSLVPTALDLVDLNVDADRGQVYITDTAGRLHVLDSETDEELAMLPGEGRIAVDSPHGRLYTGGNEAQQVRVFDTDALQQTGEIQSKAKPVADAYNGGLYLVQGGVYVASLETMTITAAISDTLSQYEGYSPNPSAVDAVVDAGSGRLFAIINNGVPGSNNGNYLYVYEPVAYQKTLTDTERSPIYVDVDPNSGRAYVSRTHMTGRSTSLLEEGREYTARLEGVFGALKVDPGLGKVYISTPGDDEGYLLVLDAENLEVLGNVPIPGGFTLRALDPVRHVLYLAARDGRVQIWSATGEALAAPVEAMREELPLEEIYRLWRGSGDIPLFVGSLYRSDDEGRSWQDIGQGLPRRGVQNLAVSPTFSQDGTLFAAPFATNEGFGVWKSTDGGRSWRIASRGLNDLLVSDLAISTRFEEDQTLFAAARLGGLYRSTDGGETWQRLTDRYLPPLAYPQPPQGVYLSPTFGQDGTVFVMQEGLHRSTDGGETWSKSFADMSSLALSPDFDRDKTLFGWSGQGGVLRSYDGGETWEAASTGLALEGYGSGRVVVAPDFATRQTIYLVWTPSALDTPAQFFRSSDAGKSWERLESEAPQAATPIELSADGSAFVGLDGEGQLVRWPVDTLKWQPVALPRLEEIEIYGLVLSPNFVNDQTVYALSEGAGILQSADAGETWIDTRFPVRMTQGTFLDLAITPAGTRFVGTPLGLYRYDGDGNWHLVGNGLPSGEAASSPEIGADDSLRVLIGGVGTGKHVFASIDGGEAWIRPLPALPQVVNVENLRLSPAFATDRAALVMRSEGKPLRSSGGGGWEEFGPPGDWTPSALHVAPTFDRGGLVFMRLQDNSLWRSADGGDSWTDASGPWGDEAPMAVIQGSGYSLDAVTFSTAFDQDHMMLTKAGGGVYRSTDEGATWSKVLDLEPWPAQAAFSPDYAVDGTLYLFQGRGLYRTTDRGQRWQALPAAPWDPSDGIKLLLSPTFSEDPTMLVWTQAGRAYQSQDGGQSWRDISGGLPGVGIRQVVFSPGYDTDDTLFLVPYTGGVYKRVGDAPWRINVESGPSPTPAPRTTAKPAPEATPTVASAACPSEPVQFAALWKQAQDDLGCPNHQAEEVALAEQLFEQGRMIWDSSIRQIYVLMEAGTWQAFEDTFVEGVDAAWDPALQAPPRQPQRGFGKVWREQLGGQQAAIGWALAGERAISGWRQRFEHGLLVWTDTTLDKAAIPGTAYLLYDDGTWEAIPAQGP